MAPSPFKKPHPAGGAVEIGKILLKTDGVIESDQMNLIADTLARLETGLAAANANIQVLTVDNAELKADNVVLKAGNAGLKTRVDDLETVAQVLTVDNAELKADNVVLKAGNAGLKTRVDDLEAAAAAAGGGGDDSVSSSDLDAVKADLETLKNEAVQVNTTVTTTLSQVETLQDHLSEVNNVMNTTYVGSPVIDFQTYPYWKERLNGVTVIEGGLQINLRVYDAGFHDTTGTKVPTFAKELSFMCDLQFLSSLKRVSSQLNVKLSMCSEAGDANPFDGFKSLTHAGGVWINLEGIKSATYDPRYRGPPKVTGIFPNLVHITRSLEISIEHGVEEFVSAFEALEIATEGVTIAVSNTCNSINVLSKLSGFGNLRISGEGLLFKGVFCKLTSLSGFDELEVVGKTVNLLSMDGYFPKLACGSIPGRLKNNGGVVMIKGCTGGPCIGRKSGRNPSDRDFGISAGEPEKFCD